MDLVETEPDPTDVGTSVVTNGTAAVIPTATITTTTASTTPTEPETVIKKKSKKYPWMEVYATFMASFSFLCTGLMRSYTSPAIASMEEDRDFLNSAEMPERQIISWVASSAALAAFFGTIISGPMLQYCGRQKTLLLLSLPCLTGWILIGCSTNVWMVFAGRACTGISVGLSTASAQLYVSECVRPKVRGMLGFLPSMMLALGVLVGFGISALNMQWRELALILSAFPVILLIMALMSPESPSWLILQNREEDAMKSLQRLRGKVRHLETRAELQEMKSSLKETTDPNSCNLPENVNPSGPVRKSNLIAKILKHRKIWMPTCISVSLMLLQQFCGINAVVFYLIIVLKATRPTFDTTSLEPVPGQLDEKISSVIVGVVQFLAFFLSLPLIDRMGRRALLLVSGILMAISHLSLGLYFYFKSTGEHKIFIYYTSTWLPLTCLCLFIASYSIGFGPVPFILMSEIFPSEVRSYLCSLSSFVNHLTVFLVILVFPTLMDVIQPHYTFWLFGFFCILSVVFVCVAVPETKGKTLVEIERYFAQKSQF